MVKGENFRLPLLSLDFFYRHIGMNRVPRDLRGSMYSETT